MHDQAPLTLVRACSKLRKRQDIGATIAVDVDDGNVSGQPWRVQPVGMVPAATTATTRSENQCAHHRGGTTPAHSRGWSPHSQCGYSRYH